MSRACFGAWDLSIVCKLNLFMFSSKKLIILFSFVLLLLLTGVGCKGGDPAAKRALEEPITLEWWGVFDTSDSFRDIIAEYQARHPNVRVKYRKLRYAEYEQALLEGWARDQGPDIFYVHNTWLSKYADQMLVMPEKVTLPVKEVSGGIKKEEKAVFRSNKTPSLRKIKDTYVDVVYRDVTRGEKVFGFPLSVDTLALYYNRSLLDQAGILNPPGTWKEIAIAVKQLTRQDELGDIVQSGIALGLAENIPRASDIVILLMLQNGAEIFQGGSVVWQLPSSSSGSYRPGAEALRFYTDFASPSKEVYTWNRDMPNAVDAFVQGRLAMMLGYSYQLSSLRAQGPRIDIGVAPVPHINPDGTDALRSPVNLANYWIQGVSKKTEHTNEAWDFVLFLTSREQAQKYLSINKRPAARRDLLQAQLEDPDIAPFAQAALTARGWFFGRNPQAAEAVVEDAIQDVADGKSSVRQSVEFHARRLEQAL